MVCLAKIKIINDYFVCNNICILTQGIKQLYHKPWQFLWPLESYIHCFFRLSLHANRCLKINISKTELPVIFSKKKLCFSMTFYISANNHFVVSGFLDSFSYALHLIYQKILWILSSKIYPKPVISHCYFMTTKFHLISCHLLSYSPNFLILS